MAQLPLLQKKKKKKFICNHKFMCSSIKRSILNPICSTAHLSNFAKASAKQFHHNVLKLGQNLDNKNSSVEYEQRHSSHLA